MKQSSTPQVLSPKNTPHVSSMVSKPVSVAWEPFAAKLALVLAELEEDQFLVISQKETNHFIQFVGQGSWGVRVETISNYYRSSSHQLKKSQITWLVKNGWQAPSSRGSKGTPQQDPDGSPNFFIDLPAPVDFDAVAAVAVATFIQIIGLSHPGMLQYEALDGGGNSLAFPALGLKQRIKATEDFEKGEQAKRLLNTVIEHTGLDELAYDADGEIGITLKGISASVGLVSDRPYARISSTLIHNIAPDLALFTRINDLNFENGHLRLVVKEGRVMAFSDLLITPFNTSHVAHWIGHFCQVVVKYKSDLVTKFGVKAVSVPATLAH